MHYLKNMQYIKYFYINLFFGHIFYTENYYGVLWYLRNIYSIVYRLTKLTLESTFYPTQYIHLFILYLFISLPAFCPYIKLSAEHIQFVWISLNYFSIGLSERKNAISGD